MAKDSDKAPTLETVEVIVNKQTINHVPKVESDKIPKSVNIVSLAKFPQNIKLKDDTTLTIPPQGRVVVLTSNFDKSELPKTLKVMEV